MILARNISHLADEKMKSIPINIGGDFHIVTDPDGSWGYDSSLTWDEIKRLLDMGFLALGTEFAMEPSRVATHRVVKWGKHICLKYIRDLEEIEKKQAPYWRRT